MLENKIHIQQEFNILSNCAVYSSSNEVVWKLEAPIILQECIISCKMGLKSPIYFLTLLPKEFLSLELRLSQYRLKCWILEEVNK